MPELPEVETIRHDLESELIGLKITDGKLLWPGTLKGTSYREFKKKITGWRIIKVERRAKNIAIKLENGYYILMHMKMTGHLLIEPGNTKVQNDGTWAKKEGYLKDSQNQYIRVILWLDNGNMLAFSDLRKFGYIKLIDGKDLTNEFSKYGPEPFSSAFNPDYLSRVFAVKKQAIKKVLMDQSVIAGIGNIYADEILWATKIHPETPVNALNQRQVKAIYTETKRILKEAISLRGTSSSDYRDTKGERGRYEEKLKVYRKTGQPCKRCGSDIKRISIGGRGTHFCPKCQVGSLS